MGRSLGLRLGFWAELQVLAYITKPLYLAVSRHQPLAKFEVLLRQLGLQRPIIQSTNLCISPVFLQGQLRQARCLLCSRTLRLSNIDDNYYLDELLRLLQDLTAQLLRFQN